MSEETEVITLVIYLLTWQDVLQPNLVKHRIRENGGYNDHIVLKFDRRLGSAASEVPVEF